MGAGNPSNRVIAEVHANGKTSRIESVNPPKITPIETPPLNEVITTYFDTKTGAVVSESSGTSANPSSPSTPSPTTEEDPKQET